MKHAKRGKPYERVVSEVLSLFDRKATVRHGQWVKGPDGQRDMDVYVDGVVDGERRRALVECKDFNRETTGPVGIGFVDALESKRRDLGVDVAFLCSNAGFTAGARRKATRVGIGLIAVMRAGDPRIQFKVYEDIYYRKFKIDSLEMGFTPLGQVNVANIPFDRVIFKGLPVQNWILGRVSAFLNSTMVTEGTFQKSHRLRPALEIQAPTGPVIATCLNYRLRVSGGWFVQEVTLSATTAVYDWLRRRVRLLPGPHESCLVGPFRAGVGGRPVPRQPDSELENPPTFRSGESWFRLVEIEGLGRVGPGAPLDDLVVPEDLNVAVTEWLDL